jgi:hypothetical protein
MSSRAATEQEFSMTIIFKLTAATLALVAILDAKLARTDQ